MRAAEKVILSWSGGKDSALALHVLQQDPRVEVVGLLTTVSRDYQRISHHGVRDELSSAAASVGSSRCGGVTRRSSSASSLRLGFAPT